MLAKMADSSWHRAPRHKTLGSISPSLSQFLMISNQIIRGALISLLCLCYTAPPVEGRESRADRLARRRQAPAYKRAMSNLSLQFIAEFLREKPLVDPTVAGELWDFDPSGLGDESHFSLLWWLPGIALITILILIALHVKLGVHRHKPAAHSRLTSTV